MKFVQIFQSQQLLHTTQGSLYHKIICLQKVMLIETKHFQLHKLFINQIIQ